MTGPRDTPINRLTGAPISERQQHHLEAIQAAGEALYEAMHFAEGSNPPGEHQEHVFMSRRMSIAATQIEGALMFARKAALETP
jgi:hypothetical protein